MFFEIINILKDMLFFTGSYSNNVFPDPLSKEEEDKYIENMLKGDKEARNNVIEHNLRLVSHIVKKFESKTSDNDDLRVVYRVSDYYNFDIDYHGDSIISFYTYSNYDNVMEIIRESIKNINDKKIVDYSLAEIDIYTSSDNIDKIKNNKLNYFG